MYLLYVELLLTQNVDLTVCDQDGNTALHYACLSSCEPAALILLDRITDLEWIDAANADLRT